MCHPLIAKRNLSPSHVSPSFLFLFNRRGAASISGLRCLAKTVQFCCDIGRGRLIYVPACTDATKKLQGLDLSSAKKQIGTCDDFRRSYSLQGALKVSDLGRHYVKGPGVDATYHVPSAEDLVSSCNFNMHSELVFHSTAMC